jgi:uncharacterized protein (TIGR02285 family)
LLSHFTFAAPQTLNPPDEKTIQWLVHDLPPVIVLKSDQLEVDLADARGPVADMYRNLASNLPQYHHRYLRIPFVRAEKLLKEKKQFCTLLLQENKERKEFLNFGEEVAVSIPPGLVLLKSTPTDKYIQQAHQVNIKDTLAAGKFRLGIVKGRYYSPLLSEVLAEDKKSFNWVNDGSVANLFSMIGKNRLDGVLAYYFEMAEYEQRHPNTPELQFVTIKEAPDFLIIRASCEKTEWGDKALKAISKVVKEKHFKESAHQYLLSVLPPERRKEYQKIYDSRPEPETK